MSDLFDNWDGGDFPPPDFMDWESGDDYSDDTTPAFIGFADLGEGLYAEVYDTDQDEPFDPEGIDFINLEDLLGTPEAEDRAMALSILDSSMADWDISSEDVRGPFPDLQSVIDWLNDTGLWPISTIGYDDETQDYYIDIES